MLKQPNSFKTNLENSMESVASKAGQLDYFRVTDVDKTTKTISVKRLNSPVVYNNVPLLFFGSLQLPKVDSLVLCGFLMNSQQPVCLGSVRDTLSNEKDSVGVTGEPGEIVQQTSSSTNSTLIKQKNDGTIIVANSNGSLTLQPDGTVKLNDLYTFPTTVGTDGQILKLSVSTVSGITYYDLEWADDETV